MKPVSSGGGFIPISPQGFQQHSHQINSSLQIQPTHVQNNNYTPNTHQYSNPNASMTQMPNKYFPSMNPVIPTQPIPPSPYVNANFTKPPGTGFFIEQRSPTQQFFNQVNPQVQQPAQQYPNFQAWKKP